MIFSDPTTPKHTSKPRSGGVFPLEGIMDKKRSPGRPPGKVSDKTVTLRLSQAELDQVKQFGMTAREVIMAGVFYLKSQERGEPAKSGPDLP